MGDVFEHLLAQPFTELDDSFLVVGGSKMPALAGKRQQVFMAAIRTSHPGKSQVQVPGAGPRSPDASKSRPGHRAGKTRTGFDSGHPRPSPGLQNDPARIENKAAFADCAVHKGHMIFGQGMHCA